MFKATDALTSIRKSIKKCKERGKKQKIKLLERVEVFLFYVQFSQKWIFFC